MELIWPDKSSLPLYWQDIQHSLNEALKQFSTCLDSIDQTLVQPRKDNHSKTVALTQMSADLNRVFNRLKSVLILAEQRKSDAIFSGVDISCVDCREEISRTLERCARLQLTLKTAMQKISEELMRLPRNTAPRNMDATPTCIDLSI